jgi:hypothetical protein
MRSSFAMKTSFRTALTMSGEVLLRWPRRRRGKRSSVCAAHQMNDENDLRRPCVDVGNYLSDARADDTLLEPRVGRWRLPPHPPQIPGQHHQRGLRRLRDWRGGSVVSGDLRIHFTDALQRLVPARLHFRRHMPVRRIGGVVLLEGAVGGVTRRFQVAQERFADLIAMGCLCFFRFDHRRDGSRLDAFRSSISIASSTRKPPKAIQRGSPLSSCPRWQA